ncbi:MAG: DUF1778 domain-containing protein [Nitrospirae bacterium]|nr:DUF1778 domain-containing protein [Nitrospirota bacterium]
MAMQSTGAHKSASKGGRLEARISVAQKRLFERAAELQGSTLTDFVVSTLNTTATKVIQDHEVMTLAGQDREIFVSVLLNPTLTSGRLKKAVKRYKKIMD